ncbi:MAG: carboxyl transferase [Desulfobacterales bacterium]|nr:carboxyl transferase [Desulfobacterales bacterium]
MSHQDAMNKFHAKKAHQLKMGGEKKLEQRRAEGRLNARERIEYLFDSETFQEIGLFSHSSMPDVAEETPCDGKITGCGLVDKRPSGVVANDMTVKGASSSATNSKKIDYMKTWSEEKGYPLFFLAESTGARMPDAMGAYGMSHGGQNKAQYRRLRQSPWISVLLGPCFGSSSWYSALSDINVMLKGAVTAVSSPKVTQIATGEDTTAEELGGWRVHYRTTGLVDAVADTEQECIDLARKYFSYLPTNANEPPPEAEIPADSGSGMADILDLIPENPNQVYNMKDVVKTIVDGGEITELKAAFGRPVITALARLGGRSVGIIANNPYHKAGALDADSCEKTTSFLVLCDSFNIPVIMLVDTPGFLIGKSGEYKKVTGKIMNWMNALSLVTVPVLTVIVGKNYGQAYLNMGAGKASDAIVAWPTARISFMDPRPAINVVYNLKKEDDPEKYEELLAQMNKNTEPWDAAGTFGVNDIIDPKKTRQYLINMLGLHTNRTTNGVGRHLLHNWPTSY